MSESHPTVLHAIAAHAKRKGGKPVLFERDPGGRWLPTTWKELWEESEAAARLFRGLGLGSGACLAVMGRPRKSWLVAELAAWRCGAVVLGLDTEMQGPEVAQLCASIGVHGLVVEDGESWNGLRNAVRGAVAFACSWEDLRRAAQSHRGPPFELPSGAQPAMQLRTSGTQGSPKTLSYTHAQVQLAAQSILRAYPQRAEGDRTLCWLPMAHAYQRVVNHVTLVQGGQICFAEDPATIMRDLREVEPSVFVAVPRFYEKVHEAIQARCAGPRGRLLALALGAARERWEARHSGACLAWGRRLRAGVLDKLVLGRLRRAFGRRLRFAISGSAPLAPEVLRFFHAAGLPVLEAYGLSESLVPVALNRPDAWREGSVGRPLPEHRIRLAPDGELLIQGAGVSAGYLGAPRSGEDWTEDGYFRTGDLARVDEDGYLFLLGRKRELIKTATGRRIFPAQVEAQYGRSPLVEQLMVVGEGRPFLAALVVPSAALRERGLTAEQMRELLRAEFQARGAGLPRSERVQDFVLLDRPFDSRLGEVTLSLKLRRAQIAANQQARIGELYARAQRAARPAAERMGALI